MPLHNLPLPPQNFRLTKELLYREAESYVSQDKQASIHAPRFGTQSKQSSKQPFLRGIKAFISKLKIKFRYILSRYLDQETAK